jgi:hypothetical protein
MAFEVKGLKELRAELKAAADAAPREVTKALKVGAVEVAARAAVLAPQGKTGRLKADARPYATARAAGVRFTLPYAPVQEFARTWQRTTKGGQQAVHYTKPGRAPRFAYKAVEELADKLMDETFARLVDILKLHGWFKG